MNVARRLTQLEAAIPPQPPAIDPTLCQAWFATLPDDGLDLMAGAAEHLKAGATLGDLTIATQGVVNRILVTWEAKAAS